MTAKELAERIRDYEAGRMEADEVPRLFQDLLDTGLAWHIGERYRETTRALREQGMIAPTHEDEADAIREQTRRYATVGR